MSRQSVLSRGFLSSNLKISINELGCYSQMEYLAECIFCTHQFFSLVRADKIIIVLSLARRGLVLDDVANGIF